MRTLIGTIYVHLPDYRFYDSPQSGSLDKELDGKYMERTVIEGQLRARLATGTSSRSGAILVTGYRGSGKTSLVRKVLRDLKDPDHPEMDKRSAHLYHHSEINLAQDDINERVILRLIAIELHKIIQGVRKASHFKWDLRKNNGLPLHMSPLWIKNRIWRFFRYLFPVGMAVLLSCAAFIGREHGFSTGHLIDYHFSPTMSTTGHDNDGNGILREEHVVNVLDRVVLPFLFGLALYALVRSLERRYAPKTSEASVRKLRIRLERLISRMEAELTRESVKGVNTSPAFSLFSFGEKESEFFPFVKTKEVELELIDVLRVFGQLCPHEQVVFVIDELDKLIPQSNVPIADRDRENPSDDVPLRSGYQGVKGQPNDAIRSRQETIAALFANLKHFLNVAEAKFIFIGNRELFDTVLADTSNRDPFFGSIFNDVVYVPSFLKEDQGNQRGRIEGISATTERFVSETILTTAQRLKLLSAQPKGTPSMGPVVQCLERYSRNGPVHVEDTKRELLRSYEVLSEIISYLTFRSNGIAKRTIQLFERNVVALSAKELENLLPEKNANDVIVVGTAPDRMYQGLFLKLTATNQYSYYLLSYFYRPYLSIHTRYYGALSDKQLVSFTYLLDHMFKFHGFSFNHGNLELAPETIGINKVPEVRKFLSDIVDSLTQNHLRVLDNGLFNYQFFKKIYHEISYLSKISELDSAAMNFTLDESLPVKQHFYKRLYHLIGLENERKIARADGLVDAIPSLHQLLGDLHYFDEEYDEALAQYRSAARMLEESIYPPDPPQDRDHATNDATAARSHRDRYGVRFREYVKLTMKQCICLEKTQAYDDAYALSNTLTQDIIKRLSPHRLVKGQGDTGTAPYGKEDNDVYVGWRLYILAIAHRLALVEKSARARVVGRDVKLVERFVEALRCAFDKDIVSARLEASLLIYVGSVLHYGNHPLQGPQQLAIAGRSFNSSQDLYRWALRLLLANNTKDIPVDSQLPAHQEEDMVKAVWHKLTAARERWGGTWQVEKGHGYWLELADSISKFGDTLFDTRNAIPYDELAQDVFLGMPLPELCRPTCKWWDTPDKGTPSSHYTKANTVAQTVLMAAECYRMAGHPFRCVFQLKKLFYFLIEVVSKPENITFSARSQLMHDLCELKELAISLIHESNRHIDRAQENKVRYQATQPLDRDLFTGRETTIISYRSEIHEMECLYHELAIKLLPEDSVKTAEDLLHLHGRDAGMQLTRMRVLILSAKLDRRTILDEVLPSQIRRELSEGTITVAQASERTIANIRDFIKRKGRPRFVEGVAGAFYSNTHLIRLLNLYGLSYMSNQSTLSWAHNQVGNWSLLLLLMAPGCTSRPVLATEVDMLELNKEIRDRIGRTLDRKALSRIDPLFHYAHALDLWESAIALHNRGKGYRRVLADMCLPEEDYTDNLYHYACSLERRRLDHHHNRKIDGFLRKMIERLKGYHVHEAVFRGQPADPGTGIAETMLHTVFE